jgi:hypothetical protein
LLCRTSVKIPLPNLCGSLIPRRALSNDTEGTFVGIEQGDYAHFLIKDKKGQDDSFIILRPDKSVQQYLDNPAKLKGHNVRVQSHQIRARRASKQIDVSAVATALCRRFFSDRPKTFNPWTELP